MLLTLEIGDVTMGEMNVVYKLVSYAGEGSRQDQAASYRLVEWQPSLIKIIPSNIRYEKNGYLKNWIYHLPRFFLKQDLYSVFTLADNNEVLCQCILTPASMRYSFMEAGDMQFGLVYTAPDHRNKKLANAMVHAVIEQYGKNRTYWWLTEFDNFASQKLAERIGFQLVGKARRDSFCGLSYYRLL